MIMAPFWAGGSMHKTLRLQALTLTAYEQNAANTVDVHRHIDLYYYFLIMSP